MELDKRTRLALDHLSKEVFGASSRWQKLIDKGYTELVTEEVTETVPAEKEGDEPTKRQVQVPVLNKFGAQQFVTKRYTIESVMEFMQKHKKAMDELRAKMAAMQEEQRKKKEEAELAEKVNDVLAGSAKV